MEQTNHKMVSRLGVDLSTSDAPYRHGQDPLHKMVQIGSFAMVAITSPS